MRKIFTHLKSVVAFAIVAAMTLSVSCSYDDTAIKKRVDKVEKSLAELTERVNNLEGQSVTLEDLLDGKAVVTKVEKNEAGDTTVTLSNGQSFVVLAEAETLQYRTVDGVLEISADGEEWVAVTVAPDCFVQSVVVNEDGSVTFTLADGRVVTVDTAELIECAATRTQVYVIAGTTKAVPFTINDAVEDINIMNQPFGWSATVEEATADVEDDDLGMGVLAVGGTNYVLNINGPSQALVNAGMAAKEGIVSVHFNTAAGACKVMNVSVNLAEITFAVDTDGNITITNTMATEQENYWGEKFFDFADFYIGVMPKAVYDEHGVNALDKDYLQWGNFESAAFTQRSTGLSNVADLQQYEEGVYEKETIELTADQFGGAFWPTFKFEIGGEYVFFISLDSKMTADYYEIPTLENAIFATYKKTIVEAELVEGSEKWNNATYHVSLAGYDNFLLGWISTAEVEEYLSYGMYGSTVEEFLPTYISGYGIMSSGAIIAGSYIDQDINLADLASMSLMEWAPELSVDTEYYFYIYPFNAQTEMDFYQHKFVPENLKICGTFATAALQAGTFEADAEFEVVSHEKKEITVNVTFSEDVTSVAYNWYTETFADAAEAVSTIMGDKYDTEFVTFDADTTYVEANHYEHNGLPNPIVLAIVALNADGEYVFVQQEFTYVAPVLPQVEITSFEYVARSYELDDNPETGGGDFVYDITCANGETFRLGLYWSYADATTCAIINGTYNYCYNALNVMYGSWAGFVIVSDTTYNESTLTVTDEQIVLRLEGIAEYVFNKNAAPVEPEQPVEPEVVAFTSATVAPADDNLNYHYVTFTDGTYNAIIKLCTRGTAEYVAGLYDQNGSFGDATTLYIGGYSTDNTWNGAECWPVTMEVIDNGDGTVTFNLVYNEYPSAVQHKGTYTGVLEGLTLVEREEPEQPGGVITYEIINVTTGYDQPGEKEMQFWYSATNAHAIDFKGMDNCTPGQPLKPGYYSSAEGTIDESYSIFDYGTTNGVMSSVECTVTDNGSGSLTYDAKFVYNGQEYAFVYTSPAQEVEESGNTVELVSKSTGEAISYGMAWTFSDAEGNNSVKLFVDKYYSYDSAADFPKANEYTTWQSSPQYVMTGSHFSFVNNTLKVNGVTYSNDAVSNAKLTVVEATSVTFEFTVDGEDYKFVYNAF